MKTCIRYGWCIAACAVISPPLHAEVFKCQVADKTLYQDKPCPVQSLSQQFLVIDKLSAEEKAAAKQRLQAWQTEHDKRKAAKQAAEQAYRKELLRQKEVEALQRAAKAQEEIARAVKEPVITLPQPVFIPYGPGWHLRPPPTKPPPTQPEPPRNRSFAPKTPTELR